MVPEETKTAVAKDRLTVSQERKGTRPIRVATLLKKEKEGTLYKEAMLAGFHDELQKIAAGVASGMPILQRLASPHGTHVAELAGLGTLAAVPLDTLQAKWRARRAGADPNHDWERKSLLGGETGHAVADIAGLGILAGPSAAALRGGHK